MNLDKAANHIVISGIKGYKILKNATKNLTGLILLSLTIPPFTRPLVNRRFGPVMK